MAQEDTKAQAAKMDAKPETISEKKARLEAAAAKEQAERVAKDHIVIANRHLYFRTGPGFEDVLKVREGQMIPIALEHHVLQHMREGNEYRLEQ